jgi:hypothetical protein
MNTLLIVRTVIALAFLGSCGYMSQERHLNVITTTQSIFLDSPDKTVFLNIDSTIPQFRNVLLGELKNEGVKVAENYANANVLLKVKTKFHGQIVSKNYEKVVKDEISFENIEQLPKPEKEREEYKKTTIDQLIEDPSGMIVGFAIGAASGMPIIGAPIGMAVGAGLNIGFSNAFAKTEVLTILDVEVHERTKKPIWYNDKRIHKKDEYSIRKYDFSEETNWKVYKTRVIVRTKDRQPINPELVSRRVASFVI